MTVGSKQAQRLMMNGERAACLVKVKQEVRSLRDDETLCGYSLLFQGSDLLKEGGQMHDHAIAHHALSALAQDPRGHQVQRILLPTTVVYCVASIRTPLQTTVCLKWLPY